MPTDTLVTVFTDMVGSTLQRTRLGDDVADGLRREHDALARAAASAHGGTWIKSTGDGALLTFSSASAAIAATVELQRAIEARNASSEQTVTVRIGAAVGDVSLEDGDVFGASVNAAARLCDAAEARQILIAAQVRALAGSRCSVELVRVGELVLKGIDDPVEAWVACWGDTAATVVKDSVTIVGRDRGSVPSPVTSFIGRDRELASLAEEISSTRLVTMLGPGGLGKTRLAIELAHRHRSTHGHEVWFVDLSAVTDQRAIATQILKTMGSGDAPDLSALEQLTAHLGDREVLLVLDNCEHVVARVAEVVDTLMRATSRTTVLATSRERLQVPGERVWPVPTFGVADEGDDATVLFAERAAAVGGQLLASDRDDVLALCRLLDGLPLAIELAAARCRSVRPGTVLERLRERPGSALGSNRSGPERQRTVDGLVAWSVDLLDARESDLFTRLGIFNGPFGLDAVEDVCSGDGLDAFDLLDLLEQLIDKSLVTTVAGAGGHQRYRLLYTIRAHAVGRQTAAASAELMGRLVDWLTRRFAQGTARLQGPEQDEVFHELADDHELLRHALQPAADGHGDARCTLAVTAGHWWLFAGHLREANALLTGLLASPAAAPAAAAALHAWHAEVLHELNDDDGGMAAARSAAAAMSAAGADADPWTCWTVGYALARSRDPSASAALAGEAADRGWLHAEVRALSRWFDAANVAGTPTDGRQEMERRLLARAEQLGDRQLLVEALMKVRFSRAHQGDVPGGLVFATRGVETAAGSVLRSLEINALLTRCDARERVGDYEGALLDSTDAIRAVDSLDLPQLRMRAAYSRPNVLAGMGRYDEAIDHLERILDDPTAARAQRLRVFMLNQLTLCYSHQGLARQAGASLRAVRDVTGGSGDWAVWGAPHYAWVTGDVVATVQLAAAQRTLFPFIGVSDHRRLDELTRQAGMGMTVQERERLVTAGEALGNHGVGAVADELLARHGA